MNSPCASLSSNIITCGPGGTSSSGRLSVWKSSDSHEQSQVLAVNGDAGAISICSLTKNVPSDGQTLYIADVCSQLGSSIPPVGPIKYDSSALVGNGGRSSTQTELGGLLVALGTRIVCVSHSGTVTHTPLMLTTAEPIAHMAIGGEVLWAAGAATLSEITDLPWRHPRQENRGAPVSSSTSQRLQKTPRSEGVREFDVFVSPDNITALAAICISPDVWIAAVGSADGAVRLVSQGRVVGSTSLPCGGAVTALAIGTISSAASELRRPHGLVAGVNEADSIGQVGREDALQRRTVSSYIVYATSSGIVGCLSVAASKHDVPLHVEFKNVWALPSVGSPIASLALGQCRDLPRAAAISSIVDSGARATAAVTEQLNPHLLVGTQDGTVRVYAMPVLVRGDDDDGCVVAQGLASPAAIPAVDGTTHLAPPGQLGFASGLATSDAADASFVSNPSDGTPGLDDSGRCGAQTASPLSLLASATLVGGAVRDVAFSDVTQGANMISSSDDAQCDSATGGDMLALLNSGAVYSLQRRGAGEGYGIETPEVISLRTKSIRDQLADLEAKLAALEAGSQASNEQPGFSTLHKLSLFGDAHSKRIGHDALSPRLPLFEIAVRCELDEIDGCHNLVIESVGSNPEPISSAMVACTCPVEFLPMTTSAPLLDGRTTDVIEDLRSSLDGTQTDKQNSGRPLNVEAKAPGGRWGTRSSESTTGTLTTTPPIVLRQNTPSTGGERGQFKWCATAMLDSGESRRTRVVVRLRTVEGVSGMIRVVALTGALSGGKTIGSSDNQTLPVDTARGAIAPLLTDHETSDMKGAHAAAEGTVRLVPLSHHARTHVAFGVSAPSTATTRLSPHGAPSHLGETTDDTMESRIVSKLQREWEAQRAQIVIELSRQQWSTKTGSVATTTTSIALASVNDSAREAHLASTVLPDNVPWSTLTVAGEFSVEAAHSWLHNALADVPARLFADGSTSAKLVYQSTGVAGSKLFVNIEENRIVARCNSPSPVSILRDSIVASASSTTGSGRRTHVTATVVTPPGSLAYVMCGLLYPALRLDDEIARRASMATALRELAGGSFGMDLGNAGATIAFDATASRVQPGDRQDILQQRSAQVHAPLWMHRDFAELLVNVDTYVAAATARAEARAMLHQRSMGVLADAIVDARRSSRSTSNTAQDGSDDEVGIIRRVIGLVGVPHGLVPPML